MAKGSQVLRVYVDTSVIGGCFDREFETWSNALMADFRTGRYIPVLSDLLAAEIEPAPPQVQTRFRARTDVSERTLS